MKFADFEGYSPGTELYWNGAHLWQQGDGHGKKVIVRERKVRSGGQVLVNIPHLSYGTYLPVTHDEWVTLAGLRGPYAPCQSRISEHRDYVRKARATKAARDTQNHLRRKELEARFKALGYSPRPVYNDFLSCLLSFNSADLQQILNVLETAEVTNAWKES